MSEGLTITTEQVDDFPVLVAQMKRMAIPDLLDEQFPVHGNWQGLSLGWTATGWLGHILLVGDHRLNHVQPWIERNPQRCQKVSVKWLAGWISAMIGWKVFWMLWETMSTGRRLRWK